MIQKLVKDVVEENYNIKIDEDTRKAEYVEARAMYYKLLRSHTHLSLDRIGRSVGRDHAGVLNALKRLDGLLSYDKRLINIYSEFNKRILEQKLKAEGINLYELNKNLEQLYEYKYVKLAKKYNELLDKFNSLFSQYEQVGNKIEIDVYKEKA